MFITLSCYVEVAQRIIIEMDPKRPLFGNTVILALVPRPPDNLSYEWMRGIDVVQGADYSGVGHSVLSVKGLKVEHEGQYICKISGDNFLAKSEPIQLQGIL